MSEPLIKDVSDTAFWIAHLRAVETERADALFRDPFAGRLAGERGADIANAMPMSGVIGWTVALRTRIIDDYIATAIEAGVDLVLNLGAGLDTRPYRMNLPPSLTWIEADYAHIVEHKETLLAGETARCRLERVKIDLADLAKRRRLFARVNAQTRKMLVITEGVVPYLDNDQVASLADDLAALDHADFWVVDYMHADTMRYRERKGMKHMMMNAAFRFKPAAWFDFFRQHGWRAKEIRYVWEEGERLGRAIPLPVPMKIAMKIRILFMSQKRRQAVDEFFAYVLLEPT
ncbi:MAG: SAM-dependent methyltransferase [Betaproteobacteria bacterium]